MSPKFKATRLDVRELKINVSPAGDTAWYSAILDDVYEWDGKTGGWFDTRWTGVLVKTKGKWVIVQQHYSFAEDKVLERAKKH